LNRRWEMSFKIGSDMMKEFASMMVQYLYL
jgi:hypothetical protein